MKQYITYLRVSTERQGRSGLGLEAQRATVEAYANKGAIIAEYVEVESGKNNARPELLKAIEQAKAEKAVLLIAKLDRLSRNIAFIFNLRDSGVVFECCDVPDANTLTIGIFATMAQNERELISDRTKKALQALKNRGERLGKPENLTNEARQRGAEANRTKAANDPNNIRAKSYAELLRANGKSFEETAKELNKNNYKTSGGKSWNKGAVYRLLSN